MNRKRVIVLGSSGSIGRQSLTVIQQNPELLELVGAHVGSQADFLQTLAQNFPKAKLAITQPDFPTAKANFIGENAVDSLLQECDTDVVLNGISGSAGLLPSIEVLRKGKNLALANKESIVMAWHILQSLAKQNSATIVPVDSEHSGLFFLIQKLGYQNIATFYITASGGALREWPIEKLVHATPNDAMQHPNWIMGKKITIDSATLANKGLEVIEAARLFNIHPSTIKVLLHPQSLVHAMVTTRDGCMYAQLSESDMKIPIQNALTWPEIVTNKSPHLLLEGKKLEFYKVDEQRSPMLPLAYKALNAGVGYCIAYNASNEIAVNAFLNNTIGFTDIARIVSSILLQNWIIPAKTIQEILHIDALARNMANRIIGEPK